jgi:hypothetical protein
MKAIDRYAYSGCRVLMGKSETMKSSIIVFLILIFLAVPTISTAAPNVSRNSGVAPLAVWCDADVEASTSSTKPFHRYEYRWIVDADMGNWGTTGKPKKVAYGAVAAFVFETAGTYTITLRVLDVNGNAIEDAGSGDTFEISVSDPDDFFAGAATTCVNQSSDSDFTGCPNGANHVSTDDLATITEHADAGERILFKRGNSWTIADLDFADNNGPVSIGAYGTCSSPNPQGICSNAPAITIDYSGSYATGDGFCNLSENLDAGKKDWRIADLTFTIPDQPLGDGGAMVGGVFDGTTDMQQITLLRIHATGGSVPIGWGYSNQDANDLITQMAVVECYVTSAASMNYRLGAAKLAVLGNVGADVDLSHCAMIWQGYKSILSHNDFSGASSDGDNGRHALSLNGPGYNYDSGTDHYCIPDAGNSCLAYQTQFMIVSDNIFGSSGPCSVSIGVQNDSLDSNVSDLIVERNLVVRDHGAISCCSENVSVAIRFNGNLSSLRNNIIDASQASTSGFIGINITRQGNHHPDPDFNAIYNNTIYRSDSSDGDIGIQITSDCHGTEVKNTLVSMPNTSETTVSDSGIDTTQSHNQSIDDPLFTDPDNDTPLNRDFTLQEGSEAINEAIATSVFDDYAGLRRGSSAYDIGAHEYNAALDEDIEPAGDVNPDGEADPDGEANPDGEENPGGEEGTGNISTTNSGGCFLSALF